MTTIVSSSYTDSSVLSQHTYITGFLSMVLLHHTHYPLPDFCIYHVLSHFIFTDMLMICIARYLFLISDFKQSGVPFDDLVSRSVSASECRKCSNTWYPCMHPQSARPGKIRLTKLSASYIFYYQPSENGPTWGTIGMVIVFLIALPLSLPRLR